MGNPMSGFFGDEDYEDIEVREYNPDQFRIGPGKHHVQVSKAEPIDKKDGTQAFIVEYSDKDGKTYTHWLNAIEAGDDKKFPGTGDTSLRDIKRAERVRVFEQLGVSRAELKTLDYDKVIGVEGIITLYKKGEYIRYGKFEKMSKSRMLPKADNDGGMAEFKAAETKVNPEEAKAFGF
jgi:hypothetical protein